METISAKARGREALLGQVSRIELESRGWMIIAEENDCDPICQHDKRVQATYTSYQGVVLLQRGNCDDAVWLKDWKHDDKDGKLLLVHDWASPGWEIRQEFASISDCADWLKSDTALF
jgi:hypothetical protein